MIVNLKNNILFFHLILQVLLVGLILGLFRTVIPALAEVDFGVPKGSFILLSTFVMSFGLVKGVSNYYAGTFSDRFNRKIVLVAGWILAIPAPLLIFYAENWYYIILATSIIGIHQGLTWSVTQISSVDITEQQSRGFAVGLNEFGGYVGVAFGGILVSYLTDLYDVRTASLIFSYFIIFIALLLITFFVNDTKKYINEENTKYKVDKKYIKDVFFKVSWKDKRLFSYCQSGHIEKYIDTAVWIFFPVYLYKIGMPILEISYIVGIYTVTWGVLQIFTGLYSDYVGRDKLIIFGMVICSIIIAICPIYDSFLWWSINSFILGVGMAMLYPSISSAVNDNSNEEWRATAIGVYRFWRDTGYASGAILIGIFSSIYTIESSFYFVSVIMLISVIVLINYNRGGQGQN